MRIGTNKSNEFMKELDQKNAEIQQIFLQRMTKLTEQRKAKVMLGDGTVTEQDTFDPNQVTNFYNKIINNLTDWTVQGISQSNNEDLRRFFIKFEVREGNYLLSGHVSVQFHVLLYYKPDYRVVQCQKELAEIIDQTKTSENELAELGEQLVIKKLKNMGYNDVDHQNLFEFFYNNDELRDKIYKEIDETTDIRISKLNKRKQNLFNELDSFLIETYQTSNVLIDENRLVAGEEGYVCTLDLEFLKNNTKEGLFDTKKIPENIKLKILERLTQLLNIMKL